MHRWEQTGGGSLASRTAEDSEHLRLVGKGVCRVGCVASRGSAPQTSLGSGRAWLSGEAAVDGRGRDLDGCIEARQGRT